MREERAVDPIRVERDRLRATLASMGDAVVATDVEGRVTFMNAEAARMTGWSPEEAAGRPLDAIFRIVNEETHAPVSGPALRALRDGVIVGLGNHTLLIARDGSECPIDDGAAPIVDDHGKILGVVLVFRDVTARRRAEIALAQSEERFRLLVEGTTDYAIFMLDPHGNVASWNPGAERIKGFAANEIIGRHFSAFYPREAVEAGWPRHELAEAATLGRFEDEGWRIRKDGSRFWANVVITAMRDAEGELRGFSKVTRDLTERMRAEARLRASETHYRRLFESARDGLLILDADTGRVVDANRVMTELLGATRAELSGKELWQIGLFEDAEAGRAFFERLRKDGFVRCHDLSVPTRGGSPVDVEVVCNTYQVDGRRIVQCNVRDVGDRRRLDRARVQTEILEGLNRRKDEFLAILSHELRNPLAPILNAVHTMRLIAADDPVRRQARDVIERQIAQLARLVDDLLDVSRITSGTIRLRRERCDLREVVERAFESARPLMAQHRHRVSTSMPPGPLWIDADPVRIEQAVVNLLTNAAKYTDPEGRIDVVVERGTRAMVRVRDDGVGIAPEMLPRVFDLFTRAERSVERAHGGLGVGLAVVKKVIELHDGTVEATSPGLGGGSEFIVRLPLARGTEDVSAEEAALAPARAQSARVLVVDDNRDAADTTAMLLGRAGHAVRVAYDGREAMTAAGEFRPDVVLLDLGLPELDGFEVARRIRRDGALSRVRLVAVSGYGQASDREQAIEAGFDEHLLKPVHPGALFEAIAAWRTGGGRANAAPAASSLGDGAAPDV